MLRIKNIPIHKKHIAFFTIIPLLVATALIKVPCPVCDGTGTISNTGMGAVDVVSVRANATDIYLVEGCFNYRVYEYDVYLTLRNNSPDQDADGFVRLVLIDQIRGQILDDQIVVVQVPALSGMESTHSVVFLTLIDDPQQVRVDAQELRNEVPDQVCEGTGKVALNYLPFYKATMDRLVAVQRIETIYKPRELTNEELEELIGQEYNTDQWVEEYGEGAFEQ